MQQDAKSPACTDHVLHHLHSVEDALRREQYREALNYTGDALVKVQNEIDWCYRTDLTLPFMREFLIQLSDTLQIVQHLIPQHRKKQAALVMKTLQDTRNMIEHEFASLATYQPPDENLDVLEIEERCALYARNNRT